MNPSNSCETEQRTHFLKYRPCLRTATIEMDRTWVAQAEQSLFSFTFVSKQHASADACKSQPCNSQTSGAPL
jgi:hypothetical protein